MRAMKRIQAFGLIGVLALSLAGAGCNRRGESDEGQGTPDIATVERQDLEIQAEASGLIEPLRVVEVKSKVSGELQMIHVETGDTVRQGELIAQVDPRDVRNAYAQTEADLASAQARVTTAKAQLRRAQELSQAGVVSRQDLENAQLEDTNAEAQLLKARTNHELAQEKTGDVTIRAPITGTIIEKTVEQGQIIASASANVSGGTTLVRMADLGTVRARALVDEVDIGRIRPGQDATVTVEAYPGRTFRGTVVKIEPQAVVDQNVTMFPVLVELPNPEGLLKPGMNSEVAVQIADRRDAVVVPNGAVVSMREAVTAGTALGLSEDEVKAKMAALREERDRRAGGEPNAGPGRPGANGANGEKRGGWNRGERGAGGSRNWRQGGGGMGGTETAGARPGVVFVRGAKGPEPKVVLLGLSNWDSTEVLRGLEPGTPVYLISVARLQQQQQQFANRMRERAGGGIFGGGQQQGGQGQGGPRGGGGRP